jgi:hypothetical protein
VLGTCIAYAFTCTPATYALLPCVIGAATLVQAALPVGTCNDALTSLGYAMRSALGSVYVCNSDDCNADANLMLLQPPSYGGALAFTVTVSVDLYGYSAATFGLGEQATFAAVMRSRLNADTVEVMQVARRRRALLDAAAFVTVTFRVPTASPDAMAAAIVALVNSDSFVAALQAGGLTAASSVAMRGAPVTTSSGAVPSLNTAAALAFSALVVMVLL